MAAALQSHKERKLDEAVVEVQKLEAAGAPTDVINAAKEKESKARDEHAAVNAAQTMDARSKWQMDTGEETSSDEDCDGSTDVDGHQSISDHMKHQLLAAASQVLLSGLSYHHFLIVPQLSQFGSASNIH